MALRKASVWLGLTEPDDAVVSYDEPLPGDDGLEDAFGAEDLPAEPAPAHHHMSQIATVRPQTFRDAVTIGEYFRGDIPVIINLQDLDTPDAKRIVDFASGLIFGRHGDIERLSSRVFLILPAHYSLLREPATLTDQGFFNQR